jgi:predicted DsbA family dithiol-disulfide isomerase
MAAKKAATKKLSAVKAPMTKSAMLDQIAQNTGLARKQVSAVFKAKPARNVVKIRALKKVKDMVI